MPAVVAIEMGYGHLRAAAPLAEALGVPLQLADMAPLADADEQRSWAEARAWYERLSRFSQLPAVGKPLNALLNGLTSIPHLHPFRDLSSPTLATRYLHSSIDRGLGRGLAAHLEAKGEALLTTFYAPAIAAERHGARRVFCVVTDSDVNRIWAPLEASKTRIHYLVPSARVMRRLQSYGVPASQMELTGFPLPLSLLGGPELPALKRNLARRLVRLDPSKSFRSVYQSELSHFLGPLPVEEEGKPPRLTFAVGGAGAQVEVGVELVKALRSRLLEGRVQLTLVAGIRPEVAQVLGAAVVEQGLEGAGVEVLLERSFDAYLQRFNQLLADTDVLWTKPSELTFYGALGLALVLSTPVGVHESFNRRWARESGAGLKQRDVRYAGGWLDEWLTDGTLAAAAWSGYMRMPKTGTFRIIERVTQT